MVYVYIFLVVAFLSFMATLAVYKYANSRSLMDIPNTRSSHTVPTPRGGGVAIVLVTILGMLLLWLFGSIYSSLLFGLIGSGSLVAGVGFLDDHGHVSAKWRFLVHLLAAIWGLYWLGGLPALNFFGYTMELGWVGNVLAALYLVWMLNLYNFMDGIDGIASIEAISVCVGGILLYWLGGFGEASIYLPALVLAAACFGFLIWNFPPAKIFMGDAGSGFVGLLLGLLSLALGHIDQSLFWGWVILLGAFIVDATVTLIRRVVKGRPFYEAHRSHAYQYLSRKWGAHRPVSILFCVVNLIWLLPVAALVVLGVLDGAVAILIAYAPLVVLAFWLKAGDEEKQAQMS